MVEPIKRVPLKDRKLVTGFHSNDGSGQIKTVTDAEKLYAEQRQSDIALTYNQLTEGNRVATSQVWQAARTPNAYNVKAQQALEPFMNLQAGQAANIFDIEAVGTPKHLSRKGGIDLFAITELSFGGTTFTGKEFAKRNNQIISMAVAPGNNEYERLREQINQLKKNPLATLSKDMHRTLLDLAKYSDVSKFENTTKNGGRYSHGGINYTSLNGHARAVPAGAAMTKNTVREIEAGLENLKSMGTPLEDAISILRRHTESTNSVLGGYNIHAYDMPALLGATGHGKNRKFLEDSLKSSLDFYHGYSAVEKNPHRLTGADLRQENIHQRLLQKKIIKGKQSKYLYHLAKDDIQANIEIAGYTYGRIMKHVNKTMKKASGYELSPAQINTTPLEKGNELFSYQSGFFDQEKHKHNLVATQVDEEGKILKPRWDSLNTPIPSNESFTIKEFLEGVTLPGSDKNGYGVRLDSKDIKGKSLLLFSESQEELAQQIHGSFLTVTEKTQGENTITNELRKLKVQHDSAFREYEKMFDYNGWSKMDEYYKLIDSAKGLEGKEGFSWKEHLLKQKKSEELAIKFPHMVERLKVEREIWDPVRKQLGASGLDNDQKSAALRHVKQKFDALGDNKAEVSAAGNKFFNFTFGENDAMLFNAKNTESIKGAFRNYIKHGRKNERAGNAEKAYKQQRARELQQIIIDNFGFSPEGLQAGKVRAIAQGLVSEAGSDGKIETALTGIANFVRDQVETKGKSSFVREVTAEVTSTRRQAMSSLTKQLPDVIADSITHANTLSKAQSAFDKDTRLKSFVKDQDKQIQELFVKNFHMKGRTDKKAVQEVGKKAAKYEELLGKIFTKYSNDFNTQIQFTEEGAPLLVLADKKSNVNLGAMKSYEELVRNANVATIELPRFDGNDRVLYGGNKKAAIMRSGISSKKGGQYHSTSVTDSLNMILDYSNKAKEISDTAAITGQRNRFVQIQQGLKYRVGRQVDPVPTDANRKIHFDDKQMYDVKNAIGGEIRSSKWDVTGYAEPWYRANARRLGLTKSADEIAEIASNQNKSFFDAMDGRAKGYAMAGGLLDFANDSSTLQGSMFGMNNRSAGRGLVGTRNADARTYMALGNYYTDSVENPHKTVNYRAVEEQQAQSVLRAAGKNQSYRTKNSFISSRADEVLSKEGEIRGITMQTGYMTDEEIALKLKDQKVVANYKKMIEQSDAPDKMKRQMIASIEKGMLSTSEGLAFMDHKLMKAFDGKDDVRINMTADNVLFANSIEEAIEKEAKKQGLGDGLWKQKGIQFEKPLQINNFDTLLDKNDKLTLGKYWNNGIESTMLDEKRFRKGDKVSILGFNADDVGNKALVLSRGRKTGHGFKAVTEGGFRATMVPMLQEVMEDLYGVKGVEQILGRLEEKKGATDLPSLIRGYDTQIRQQFNGNIKRNIKGFGTEEEALSALYQDVENTMGIKTTNKDGQYIVDSNFGSDGRKLDVKKRTDFSKRWQQNLGINREVFGDITMAHDVWNRQGAKNSGKMTVKEMDMIDRSMTRTELYAPGQTSEYSKFLRESVYGSATDDVIKVQQKVFGEIVKAASDYNRGWTPKAGDAVIDYTTDGVGVMTDVNAQMKDDVLHISKDAYAPVPEKSGHKQVFTISDYNKTVVNAGALDFKTDTGQSGKLQKHLLNTKGTAYMKLPDFAAKQYIPLVDVDSMSMPSDTQFSEKTVFLDTMKGHYASIARKTDEYNGLFAPTDADVETISARKETLSKEINREVSGLLTTMGDSTSKEGMARIMSRKMPMSTMLQFGGVNAALAYHKDGDGWKNNGKVSEGEIYMNQKDVRNLIGDKAENIAKSWGVDTKAINGDMTDYVMKNWNANNTYSTTVRYPSIDVGTSQALKIKVDNAVGEGQVVGLHGMAERISGDYDGDNLAIFMSHYGIDDDKRRAAVLGDITKLHNFDASKNQLAADVIMNDMEKGFRQRLATQQGLEVDHKDIINASNSFFSEGGFDTGKMTLGSLHGSDAHEAIRKSLQNNGLYDDWGTFRSGDDEHEKSILARATSSTIGSVDNTRMRMSGAFMTIAETKYKAFNQAEGALKYSQKDYVRETAMVDEFLREYSQKAISAKKTEGSTQTASDVMGSLYKMIDDINKPSTNLDFDLAAEELISERGLFKKKPFLEIGNGEVYKGSRQSFVKQSLQLLAGAEDVYKEMGIPGFRESSMLTAASQGIGFHNFSHMVRTGEHIPGAIAVNEIANVANEHGNDMMVKHQGLFEESVKRIHSRKVANINGLLDDAGGMYDIMNNQQVDPKIVPNNSMPIHRTIKDSLSGSLTDLAVAGKNALSGPGAKFAGIAGAGFGALWATNALMKPAPTPEGLQEMAPVPMETLGAPTARVTPNQNGEYLNISVNAKTAGSMNNNALAALLNNEIMSMSNVKMNTSVSVNDNSQNIDSKWMEGAVANVMNKGYAY